jgi:hypothetical protein
LKTGSTDGALRSVKRERKRVAENGQCFSDWKPSAVPNRSRNQSASARGVRRQGLRIRGHRDHRRHRARSLGPRCSVPRNTSQYPISRPLRDASGRGHRRAFSSPSTASLSGVARCWHSNAYFSLFSSLFFFDPPNRFVQIPRGPFIVFDPGWLCYFRYSDAA